MMALHTRKARKNKIYPLTTFKEYNIEAYIVYRESYKLEP